MFFTQSHVAHADMKELMQKVDNIQKELVEQNKLIEDIKEKSKRVSRRLQTANTLYSK